MRPFHRALLALLPLASSQRSDTLFNDGWLFHLGDVPGFTCSSPASAAAFPISTSGTLVHGLTTTPAGSASAAACAAVCGSNCTCQSWQYCATPITDTLCGPPSAARGAPAPAAPPCAFPLDLTGVQCAGLSGAAASSEAECAAACCGDGACEVYQWCPAGGGHACGPPASCWVGALAGAQCKREEGWASRARNATPSGPLCQTGLLADYGPGNWQTSGVGQFWVGAARLAPPAPPPQATGPGAAAYDDAAWEPLTLPHDYLQRLAPSNTDPAPHQNEHGSIPFANAWYRKHFTVPEGTTLARLQFDGAYRSASVFLNGALAAQHEEGYTGFSVWLHNVSGAPLALGEGAGNVVAVYLAVTTYTYELWGYEGAGITRDVRLVLHSAPLSIVPWGVAAGAEVAGPVAAPGGPDGSLTAPARVAPEVDVANAGAGNAALRLTATVRAPSGGVVGASSMDAELPAGGWARLQPPPIALAAAALWSPAARPDAPRRPMYTLTVALLDAASGAVLDAVNVTFGVRSVAFDPSAGLTINGFPTKLRGLSIHQDFAGVGQSVPPNIQAYRVQRLLDIGANAWRCAHNPIDTNLLDELDARGVMVWECVYLPARRARASSTRHALHLKLTSHPTPTPHKQREQVSAQFFAVRG